MVVDPYLARRIEAIERELAEIKAKIAEKPRRSRRKVRGSMKGTVEIEDVKRARRELFGVPDDDA